MTDKHTLFSYSKNNLTLKEALQDCPMLDNGIALLYSLKRCQFAKVRDRSLIDNRDRVIPLDNFAQQYIFEARIFTPDCELRWLNEDNGRGISALISEGELQTQLPEWQPNPPLMYLESLPQQYLLWGQKTKLEASQGWQKLASARIGTLAVPLHDEIAKNSRVYLKTQEYLGEVDRDNGNVAVIEERLIKLEVK